MTGDEFSGIAGFSTGSQRYICTYAPTGLTPPTANSLLSIGSISKSFTGMLLADMVYRGEVELDDCVASLLSPAALSECWNNVTLADLATHQAGVPTIPPNLTGPPWDPYRGWSTERLYEAASLVRFRRPSRPIRGLYSNFGFAVLAEALSRRAATSYPSLLESRVLQPLRLSKTTLADLVSETIATGCGAGAPRIRPWEFGAMTGAAGLASTVGDLLTVGDAIVGSRSDTSIDISGLRQCCQLPAATASRQFDMRLGWMINQTSVGSIFWASGQVSGMATLLMLQIQARVVLVIAVTDSCAEELVCIGAGVLVRTLG